jgi:hypothetical protein
LAQKAIRVYPVNNTLYARWVAAVAGGCGLLVITIIFFVTMSFLLRYTLRMERHKVPKTGRRKSLTVGTAGGGAFYGGSEVQSAQALFSSLSATNIVSGASDVQLDAHASRGVYVNRGFESPQLQATTELNENPYRPIEIKSQQRGSASGGASTSYA